MLKHYYVWNAEQISGIEFDAIEEAPKNDNERIEIAQAVINNYPNPPKMREIEQGGAYYEPMADRVTMPKLSQFKDSNSFYHVYFHELIHSTGHESRLNRDLAGNMKSNSYANEELIAEMGACFMMSMLGLDFNIENSSAYVKGWRNRIAEDNTLILKACSHAQKSIDHIMEYQYEVA